MLVLERRRVRRALPLGSLTLGALIGSETTTASETTGPAADPQDHGKTVLVGRQQGGTATAVLPPLLLAALQVVFEK